MTGVRKGGWRARAALLVIGAAVFGLVTLGMAGARADTPAPPIAIVAAESVYGGVAAQIGGAAVAVTSILNNPDQDPHLFEPSPATARRLAAAPIVIANGAGYDPWIETLLAASPNPSRRLIIVARLAHRPPGGNPHLWYDPAVMPLLVERLAADFQTLDPAHAAQYRQRLAGFLTSLAPLAEKRGFIRAKWAGIPVTATEPVFGLMADALGFKMRNLDFQRAVMNGTEPGASAIARFESDFTHRAVRLLFYNTQTSDAMTRRLLALAHRSKVPVVGVSETEPPGKTYQAWMMDELVEIEKALAGGAS